MKFLVIQCFILLLHFILLISRVLVGVETAEQQTLVAVVANTRVTLACYFYGDVGKSYCCRSPRLSCEFARLIHGKTLSCGLGFSVTKV